MPHHLFIWRHFNPRLPIQTRIRIRTESELSPWRKFNWLLIRDWQPTKVAAIVSSWQILALPLAQSSPLLSLPTPPFPSFHSCSDFLAGSFTGFLEAICKLRLDLFSPGLLFLLRYSLFALAINFPIVCSASRPLPSPHGPICPGHLSTGVTSSWVVSDTRSARQISLSCSWAQLLRFFLVSRLG